MKQTKKQKQEQFEEVAERKFQNIGDRLIFEEGAKWQQENSNINALDFEIDSLKREIKLLKHEQERSYSEEEFLEFSEWVSHNDWVYLPSKGYWVNEEQEESEQKFTTKELTKLYKNK